MPFGSIEVLYSEDAPFCSSSCPEVSAIGVPVRYQAEKDLKRHKSKSFRLARQHAAASALPRVGQLPRSRHGTFVTRRPRDHQMKPRPGAAPQFFKQLGGNFLCGNFLEQPLLDLLGERSRAC